MRGLNRTEDQVSRRAGSTDKASLKQLTPYSAIQRGLALVVSLTMVSTFGGMWVSTAASAATSKSTVASSSALTPKAVALDNAMRALWEAHGTWTERAIVDFVGGLPDTSVVIAQLLANQTDIGNAVKPYYGGTAGNALTKLLQSHINDAVVVLKAAQSGDANATTAAIAVFDANGVQIATFLHAANPRYWSLSAMEMMMSTHLSQVVGLATDQLTGDYTSAVALYGVYIGHLLNMADMLSSGIEQQFPKKFK
jgi:hypothetical protein